jgi:hypothetical protein
MHHQVQIILLPASSDEESDQVTTDIRDDQDDQNEQNPLILNNEVAPSDEQQRLLSNILSSMRTTCCVPSIPLYPNRTDIEEDFLDEIDDTVNTVRSFTTLQPKSLLITQRRQQQFSEEIPLTSEMLRLQEQLNSSNLGAQIENQTDTQSEYTESETQIEAVTEKVQCSFCPKQFTKRGMTKHVNSKHPHGKFFLLGDPVFMSKVPGIGEKFFIGIFKLI